MNTSELQQLAHHASVLDRVAKFKVGQVQSITLQANMLSTTPGNRGEDTVALRLDPSDPRFTALLQYLTDEANAQSTASSAVISAAGMTPTVDQAAVDSYAADALEAKKQYDALVERNRQKKILADALANEAAAKAPVV